MNAVVLILVSFTMAILLCLNIRRMPRRADIRLPRRGSRSKRHKDSVTQSHRHLRRERSHSGAQSTMRSRVSWGSFALSCAGSGCGSSCLRERMARVTSELTDFCRTAPAARFSHCIRNDGHCSRSSRTDGHRRNASLIST
jgi:hypothetical protein